MSGHWKSGRTTPRKFPAQPFRPRCRTVFLFGRLRFFRPWGRPAAPISLFFADQMEAGFSPALKARKSLGRDAFVVPSLISPIDNTRVVGHRQGKSLSSGLHLGPQKKDQVVPRGGPCLPATKTFLAHPAVRFGRRFSGQGAPKVQSPDHAERAAGLPLSVGNGSTRGFPRAPSLRHPAVFLLPGGGRARVPPARPARRQSDTARPCQHPGPVGPRRIGADSVPSSRKKGTRGTRTWGPLGSLPVAAPSGGATSAGSEFAAVVGVPAPQRFLTLEKFGRRFQSRAGPSSGFTQAPSLPRRHRRSTFRGPRACSSPLNGRQSSRFRGRETMGPGPERDSLWWYERSERGDPRGPTPSTGKTGRRRRLPLLGRP